MASNNKDPGRRILQLALHDAIQSKLSVTSSVKRDLDNAKREKWKNRKSKSDKNSVTNLLPQEMAEIYKKVQGEREIEKRNLQNETSNSKLPLGRGRGRPLQNPVNIHRKKRAQSLPSLGDRCAAITEDDESLDSELAFNSFNWPVQFSRSLLQNQISSGSLAAPENEKCITLNDANYEAFPRKSQSNDNLVPKSPTILTFPEPVCNISNTFNDQSRPFSVTHADDIKRLLQIGNRLTTSSDVTNKKMISFYLENEKCDADPESQFVSENLLPRSYSASEIPHPFDHEIKKSNSCSSKNIMKPEILPPHSIPSNPMSSGLFCSDINKTYPPPIIPNANFNYMISSDCMPNYSPMGIGFADKTSDNLNEFLHAQPIPNGIYANNNGNPKSSPGYSKYLHPIENTYPKVPHTVLNSGTYKHSNHTKSSQQIIPDNSSKEIYDFIDSYISKNSDSKSKQSSITHTKKVANRNPDSSISELTNSIITIDLNPNSEVLVSEIRSDERQEKNNSKSSNTKLSITNCSQIPSSVKIISVTGCREINPVVLCEAMRINNLINELK